MYGFVYLTIIVIQQISNTQDWGDIKAVCPIFKTFLAFAQFASHVYYILIYGLYKFYVGKKKTTLYLQYLKYRKEKLTSYLIVQRDTHRDTHDLVNHTQDASQCN